MNHKICFCLQERKRAILPHLFRCEKLAVCVYSGTLRALHLRQTYAGKIKVVEFGFFVFKTTVRMNLADLSRAVFHALVSRS
jgi:hypothetical protein